MREALAPERKYDHWEFQSWLRWWKTRGQNIAMLASRNNKESRLRARSLILYSWFVAQIHDLLTKAKKKTQKKSFMLFCGVFNYPKYSQKRLPRVFYCEKYIEKFIRLSQRTFFPTSKVFSTLICICFLDDKATPVFPLRKTLDTD